jgi:hypothetical protein
VREGSKGEIRPVEGSQLPQVTTKKGSLFEKGLHQSFTHSVFSSASEWVPVNPRPVMVTQQTVRNLALGDKFFLRVAAVGSAGAGPPAVLDQPVHIQEIVGKVHTQLPLPSPP